MSSFNIKLPTTTATLTTLKYNNTENKINNTCTYTPEYYYKDKYPHPVPYVHKSLRRRPKPWRVSPSSHPPVVLQGIKKLQIKEPSILALEPRKPHRWSLSTLTKESNSITSSLAEHLEYSRVFPFYERPDSLFDQYDFDNDSWAHPSLLLDQEVILDEDYDLDEYIEVHKPMEFFQFIDNTDIEFNENNSMTEEYYDSMFLSHTLDDYSSVESCTSNSTIFSTELKPQMDFVTNRIKQEIKRKAIIASDKMADIAETISIFAWNIRNANTWSDFCISLLSLYKHLCPGSAIGNFLKYFHKIFETEFTTSVVDTLNAQAGFRTILKSAREAFTNFSTSVNSEIVNRFRKMYLYILSSSFGERLGYTFTDQGFSALEEEKHRRKYDITGMTFYMFLMDTTLFLLEKGVQVFDSSNFMDFFHCDSSYGQFLEDYNDIKEKSLKIANPKAVELNVSEFLSKCTKTIEIGRIIVTKLMSLKKTYDVFTINRMLGEIVAIKTKYIMSAASRSTRDPPFTLLIYGTSSVGKSSVCRKCITLINSVMNQSDDDEFIYTRSSNEKHWNGFCSEATTCLCDDIGTLHPNKCPTGDPALMELIQMCNAVPFSPEQAGVEEKGKTPFLCTTVIATTNIATMNAPLYFTTPQALRRRFPYTVEVIVKPEFRIKGTTMIDSNRMLEYRKEHGCEADAWLYTVTKVLVNENNCIDQPVFSNEPASVFFPFLAEKVKQHLAHNIVLKEALNTTGKMCPHYRFNSCEDCDAIPSINTDDFVPFEHTDYNESCTALIREHFIKAADYDGLRKYDEFFYTQYGHYPTGFEKIDEEDKLYEQERKMQEDLRLWKSENKELSEAGYTPEELVVQSGLILGLCFLEKLENLFWYLGIIFIVPFEFLLCFYNMLVFPELMPEMPLGLLGYVNTWALNLQRKWIISLQVAWLAQAKVLKNHRARYNVIPYTKATIKVLGSEVSDSFYEHPQVAGCVIAAITVAIAAYSMNNSVAPQGAKGSAPRAMVTERENVYYNSGKVTSTLPQCINRKVQDTYEQALNTAKRTVFNLCVFVEGSDTDYNTVNIISLGNCDYVTTKHIFSPKRENYVCMLQINDKQNGISGNIKKFIISQDDMCKHDVYDLCVVRILNTPPFFSINNMFTNDPLDLLNPGHLIHRNVEGKITMIPATCINIGPEEPYQTADGQTINLVKQPAYVLQEKTFEGLCGALITAKSKQNGITFVGIHVAGVGQRGRGFFITPSIIAKLRLGIETPGVAGASEIKLSVPSVHVDLYDEVHPKSPIRFIENGVGQVFGSLSNARASPVSRVQPTLIAQSVRARMNLFSTHGKPNMKSPKPKHIALKPMLTPTLVSSTLLNKCRKAMVGDIIRELPPEQFSLLHPYDLSTVINGAAGVTYVDSMNLGTSMGFPYNCSKKNWIESIPPTALAPDGKTFKPEILQEVKELEDLLESGVRGNSIFKAHLKDEPVSERKIKTGAVRVFAGAPIAYSILMRKYFLCFVRLIQNNKFIFECAIGTNAMSKEWGEIRSYLKKHGKKIVGGDYSNFDKHMLAKMIIAAFRVLIDLAEYAMKNFSKLCLFTETDIIIMEGLMTDTAYPIMDFFGELIQFFVSNPSGQPLTTIINCIVNSLYVRMAFSLLADESKTNIDVTSFKMFVNLATYGDDNIMNVSDQIPWFNHTSIQRALGSMGIAYTMSDKESESVEYITLEEADFLKRKFVYDKDLDFVLAPLDESSIAKMLNLHVASKSVTPEEQVVDILRCANREYFFYGEKTFTTRNAQIHEVISDCNLGGYFMARPLLTFEDIKATIDMSK